MRNGIRIWGWVGGLWLTQAIGGCGADQRVGSNCDEEACVLSASAALAVCETTCDTISDHCAADGSACDMTCQLDIDAAGFSVCDAEFEALHACCDPGADLECDEQGFDACKVACPDAYVSYRACTTSGGMRREASAPAERIGSCVDVCGQIARGCTSEADEAIDECIEECVEERGACAGRVAWLELAACCAGTDYAPVCGPEGLDLDIKRCRSACPAEWDACERDEEGSAVEL